MMELEFIDIYSIVLFIFLVYLIICYLLVDYRSYSKYVVGHFMHLQEVPVPQVVSI